MHWYMQMWGCWTAENLQGPPAWPTFLCQSGGCTASAKIQAAPGRAQHPTFEVLCPWHSGFLRSCFLILFGLTFTWALAILLW